MTDNKYKSVLLEDIKASHKMEGIKLAEEWYQHFDELMTQTKSHSNRMDTFNEQTHETKLKLIEEHKGIQKGFEVLFHISRGAEAEK